MYVQSSIVYVHAVIDNMHAYMGHTLRSKQAIHNECTLHATHLRCLCLPSQGAPVVLLVHGYGASSYHWRYNIPALADAGYHVYAIDLLGFGYSEKALTDYGNGAVGGCNLVLVLQLVS